MLGEGGNCGVNPATGSLVGVKEKHFEWGGWARRPTGGVSLASGVHSISRDCRAECRREHTDPRPEALGSGGGADGAGGGRKSGSCRDSNPT